MGRRFLAPNLVEAVASDAPHGWTGGGGGGLWESPEGQYLFTSVLVGSRVGWGGMAGVLGCFESATHGVSHYGQTRLMSEARLLNANCHTPPQEEIRLHL